jgi:SAM-dependent methyltransferase
MGATQFRLLCTLGLRAEHRLLDFGCGSLRAGRFLISYLDAGNYYGVDPNQWLIDEAIEQVVGPGLIEIKQPIFDHNDRFEVAHLDTDFDVIVAQSIFSHTCPTVAAKLLGEFAGVLRPGGRIVATFVEGPDEPEAPDWVYPGVDDPGDGGYRGADGTPHTVVPPSPDVVRLRSRSGRPAVTVHAAQPPWRRPLRSRVRRELAVAAAVVVAGPPIGPAAPAGRPAETAATRRRSWHRRLTARPS